MTTIIALLVVGSILAMAWAFLASSRLAASVEALDRRLEARLDQTPTNRTESGEAKPETKGAP